MASGNVEAMVGVGTDGTPVASKTENKGTAAGVTANGALGMLLDVRLTISVELGRAHLPIRDVMALTPGAVVELERSASEPVEILANGRCIGRGEVVVVGDHFGVRVTELADSHSHG